MKDFGFPHSDRLLFHIEEAMSWDSVRDLGQTKSIFLIAQNITAQTEAPEESGDAVRSVRECLDEALAVIRESDE